MRIRKVEVTRFRGIESLSWQPQEKLACLIGPGDSTKSTILDAIELALTPRYDPGFSDLDFFKLDASEPIEITVTVGDPPETLKADSKFGLFLRGWDPQKGVQDEPDDLESVLSIRLTVDGHLEPTWVVWNERDEKPISAYDRAALGMARIGSNVNWHLSWSRRSALTKSTDTSDEAKPSLARAVRAAREKIDPEHLPEFSKVAESVEKLAGRLGVQPTDSYQPNLSPLAISLRHGALSLHDGEIPLTSAGSGTQRLAAIAVQLLSIPEGAILLLDEVELGLEPHRLRHLLRYLRQESGQVVMTSHSSVAIEELSAGELAVVKNRGGLIEAQHVSKELQPTVRAASEALLSPSVIVCEGKTEVGLCRAWDKEVWQAAEKPPLARIGVYPIDGGGSSAPQRALDLADLGYRVALFIDSDKPLPKSQGAALRKADVAIIQWADSTNTEQRVCRDLPLAGLQRLVDLAIEERSSEQSIRQSVLARLQQEVDPPEGVNLAEWVESGVDEQEIRQAISGAATVAKKEWFKRIDLGETLGEVISSFLDKIADTDLHAKISMIEEWVHGN